MRVDEPAGILLVEDNPGDVRLTSEALKERDLHHGLFVASDGESALEVLRRGGEHSDAPRPAVIMLDVNLPGMSGVELLEHIKADSELAQIPVIVLTTATADHDPIGVHRLRASRYLPKPSGLDQYSELVDAVVELLPD